MLWPIVLPIQITSWVIAVLVIAGTIVLVRRKWHPVGALFSSTLIGMLLFIPSCIGTQAIVDSCRFGVFEYETAKEIGDSRVWRSVPMKATRVTVHKYSLGHRAKFVIDQGDLEKWIDEIWKRAEPYSQYKRADIENHIRLSSSSLKDEFSGLGWDLPAEYSVYHGPVARNGASITFWYDHLSGTAFSRCSYW